jgi:peptidoglycan/LPS O-acetylase OafA/YrhL
MPQLDGLRAVAVSLVLFQHYGNVEWPILNGRTGVILFFILSGFLITGILLDSRIAASEAGAAAGSVLPRFYARRFLRIVPAFYAVLAVTFVARIGDVTHYVAWHMAYLSNVLFCIQDVWPKTTSHLWSLAVEEQFYLAWPLVVLFVPYRRLFAVTAALVVAGPAARLVVLTVSHNVIAPYVLPICVFDSFGLGAALACVFRQPIGSGRWSGSDRSPRPARAPSYSRCCRGGDGVAACASP